MMSAQVVFVIRTYAFTGCNKLVLAVVVACWAVLFGSFLWISSSQFNVSLEWHALMGDSACFAAERAPEDGPQSSRSNAWLALAALVFDSLMTAIVFFHFIRYRAMSGQLIKAFLVHGLTAYVMLSAVNIVVVLALFLPTSRYYGIGIFHGPACDIIACRLVLMLPRIVDSTTTQLQSLTRSETGRQGTVDGVLSDDAQLHRHQMVSEIILKNADVRLPVPRSSSVFRSTSSFSGKIMK